MDRNTFSSAIDQICEEKAISKEKVLETIEMAIAAAYKKDYGKKGQNIRARFDLTSGQAEIFQVKLVLDETMMKSEEEIAAEEEAAKQNKNQPRLAEAFGEGRGRQTFNEDEESGEKKVRFNPERHIMVDEAQKIQSDIKAGEELWLALESHSDFGRIAAQTAKQVIIQRLREAEREAIFNDYKNKEGEIASGVVQRIERGMVFVDIGKTTGVLFPEEQIANEFYRTGQRLKVLILEVQKDAKGPGIILSRSHNKMVAKIFELEVPEIASGAVEIKAIAREAGSRTKIAVASKEEKVDPIGSCVGQKGTRVQAVISELSGEKIDIIEWSPEPAKFIANSLAPAKVLDAQINEAERIARVTVPENQLSLAIGKQGQNVRLAAKLTGWKIDVLGASTTAKEEKIDHPPDEIVEEKKELSENKKEAPAEKVEEKKDTGGKKIKKVKKDKRTKKEGAGKKTPTP